MYRSKDPIVIAAGNMRKNRASSIHEELDEMERDFQTHVNNSTTNRVVLPPRGGGRVSVPNQANLSPEKEVFIIELFLVLSKTEWILYF